MTTPDFVQLATQSRWSLEDWRAAWYMLPIRELWPTVLSLVQLGYNPEASAAALASLGALEEIEGWVET